MLKIIKIRQ